MKDISVTELRKNLQTCLAGVQRGKHLRVTSRGKVIAEITPPVLESGHADIARQRLRGSILRYDDPTAPTFDSSEWDMHQ